MYEKDRVVVFTDTSAHAQEEEDEGALSRTLQG